MDISFVLLGPRKPHWFIWRAWSQEKNLQAMGWLVQLWGGSFSALLLNPAFWLSVDINQIQDAPPR